MVSFYDMFLPSYVKPKMSRHDLISRLYGNSCNFHLFNRALTDLSVTNILVGVNGWNNE